MGKCFRTIKGTMVAVQSTRQRAATALLRSAWTRWATLALVIIVGWLLLFWAVNALPSDGTTPAPASTSVPSGDL